MFDSIMHYYVKACGGIAAARRLGIIPPLTKAELRYTHHALLSIVLTEMRKLEKAPHKVTEAALLAAERSVNHWAKLLSQCGTTTDTKLRKARERALFHATARRDAMKYTLREISPQLHEHYPTDTPIPLRQKRPPGVSMRLSNLRYRLKAKLTLEPSLILAYESKREEWQQIIAQHQQLTAELYLAQTEIDATLAQRRAIHDNARNPRGTRARLIALRAKVKAYRLNAKAAQTHARGLHRQLCICQTQIVELREKIAENEKISILE